MSVSLHELKLFTCHEIAMSHAIISIVFLGHFLHAGFLGKTRWKGIFWLPLCCLPVGGWDFFETHLSARKKENVLCAFLPAIINLKYRHYKRNRKSTVKAFAYSSFKFVAGEYDLFKMLDPPYT